MADLNDFDDKLQDDDNKVDVSDDEKSVDNNDDSVVDENESMADDEDVDDMFDMEDEQPDEIAVDVEKTQTNTDMLGLGDSDVSDDEYDGYEKFDEQDKRDIIQNHYPELVQHNYQEVEKMLDITRDDSGVIRDQFHRTIPFVTRYERARVLGERTKQLDGGAHPMIPIEPNVIDSYTIALKEYAQKKIPFIIKRPLPNGACEYWRLRDLEHI